MTLSYDVARCPGHNMVVCQSCLRYTEPGRPDGQQTFILAKPDHPLHCDSYISPVREKTTNR